MKNIIIQLAALLLGIAPFISAKEAGNSTGPHGGQMEMAGAYFIELKASSPEFHTWLLDQHQQPISNKKVKAELTFFFLDETSLDVPLLPYGADGFKTETIVSGYYACRVSFKVGGKLVSAKFHDENAVVRKPKE